MLGVGAAWLVRDPGGARWLVQRRRLLYLLGLALGVVLLVFTKASWALDTYQMSTFGFTITSFFYASLVLLAVSHPEGPVGRFFNLRPLIALGAIAYGLYLFHEPVKDLLHLAFTGQAPRLASWRDAGIDLLAFCITLVIARLSWLRFEKRFVRRGHRYSYWPSDAPRVHAERRRRPL
jgi:peptidoglycan/LPS O-acetylase OafA/YrhL